MIRHNDGASFHIIKILNYLRLIHINVIKSSYMKFTHIKSARKRFALYLTCEKSGYINN